MGLSWSRHVFLSTFASYGNVNTPSHIHPVVICAGPDHIVISSTVVQETRGARCEQEREYDKNKKDGPCIQFHL